MHDQNIPNEFEIPGFTTRHLVDMQATDWAGILNLISWIHDESGHIAYFRTKADDCGRIHVAMGVEAVLGDALRQRLKESNGFLSPRIEHLLIGEPIGAVS